MPRGKAPSTSVADLGFVAMGGGPRISRGHREFQGTAKFTNLEKLIVILKYFL